MMIGWLAQFLRATMWIICSWIRAVTTKNLGFLSYLPNIKILQNIKLWRLLFCKRKSQQRKVWWGISFSGCHGGSPKIKTYKLQLLYHIQSPSLADYMDKCALRWIYVFNKQPDTVRAGIFRQLAPGQRRDASVGYERIGSFFFAF